MKQKKIKYVGGISNCPECGSNLMTTCCSKPIDIGYGLAPIRWYHKCVDCGHRIYIKKSVWSNRIREMRKMSFKFVETFIKVYLYMYAILRGLNCAVSLWTAQPLLMFGVWDAIALVFIAGVVADKMNKNQ